MSDRCSDGMTRVANENVSGDPYNLIKISLTIPKKSIIKRTNWSRAKPKENWIWYLLREVTSKINPAKWEVFRLEIPFFAVAVDGIVIIYHYYLPWKHLETLCCNLLPKTSSLMNIKSFCLKFFSSRSMALNFDNEESNVCCSESREMSEHHSRGKIIIRDIMSQWR